MKDETKSKLNSLIEMYDKKLAKVKNTLEEHKIIQEDISSLSEFIRIRKDVIHPVMEALRAELMRNGHDCVISEDDGTFDSKGKIQSPRIIMKILPKDYGEIGDREDFIPHVSFFISYKQEKTIFMHVSNILPGRGTNTGSLSEFKSEKINSDLVEQEVMKLLEDIFNR